MKKESKFQHELISEIQNRFPGAIVLKNDPDYKQGIPDLLVLYNDKWAVLECKRSATEPHQPNQDYYVETMDEMSFGRFIYPENKEATLNEMEQTFRPDRKAFDTVP